MLFGEMLDDERHEGLREGQQQERARMLALIQAMANDGKSRDISRLASDSDFFEDMLEQYHMVPH